MKKFIFSLIFLFIMLVLYSVESNAQSFPPFSFLKNAVPFVSINEYSKESNKGEEEVVNENDKKIEQDDSSPNKDQRSNSEIKPVSSRITIDLGKALFEKYIK
jgi:hypothetical protein